MVDVAIAIPTYRRPEGLRRLLAALAMLDTEARVEVIVADNDAERHEGLDLCNSLRETYRWSLTAFVTAERGIAQARNALAEHALARSEVVFIAMLDDDEWPDAGWLDAFLRIQRQTGADALRGTILRAFGEKPPLLTARCQGIAPVTAPSGVVPMIEGAGNVLIARRCFDDLPKPWFDPDFALSGGEDRDFFTRLRLAGRTFAWADKAVVHEFVPASRTTLRWALSRAYRVGNSDMRVFLKYPSSLWAKIGEGLKIVAAVTLYPALQLILAPFARRRVEPLCKVCRAAGKIAAVFGRRYDEYATVHGG